MLVPQTEDDGMFSHIMVGTSDLDRAKKFYDPLMATLGAGPAMVDGHRMFYMHNGGVFAVSQPINGEPCTYANGGTIGFACASPDQAKAWHDAGVANGGTSCEEPPGVREGGMGKMYLAYLRDPDGNKLCALHRM
jgi:catechol 2,3-dioxygenase-like lactoylglutathione lyase family enzyme